MKGSALVLLALSAASVNASSVAASSAASAWLQSHKSPTDDQLKELQGVNPEAAAIVNALLSKHMSHMHKHEQSGAEIFRSMMTPPHLAKPHHAEYASAEAPYASAEVQTPVIDQQHFNANAAADRDESAVSRLLGAVASMGGSKGSKISALLKKHKLEKQKVENPLAQDASLFEEEAPATPAPLQSIEKMIEPPAPQVQEQAAPALLKRENSYLKGIDLSGDMPVAVEAKHRHPKKENSYLKGMDMSGSADSLTSFSFDDSAAAAAAPTPMPKKVAPKPKKSNAFLKWLGVVDKAPAPVEKPAAVAQTPKKTNSYLDSVKFFG